jgi:hypothetical protein
MRALVVLALAAAAAAEPASMLRDDVEGVLRVLDGRVPGRAAAWGEGTPVHPRDGGPVLAADAGGGVLGWLGASAGFWFPTLEGSMAANGGEKLTFGELGLDDHDGTATGGVSISLGGFGLRLDGFALSFEGSEVVTRDITFGGITFTVGTTVASSAEIANLRLLGTAPIVKSSVVSLYLQGGVSYFQLEGEVSSLLFGSGRESADVPIPVVGALLQVRVSNVLLELDVTGMAIDFGDVSGELLDITASAGVTIFKVASLRAGYRLVAVDGEVDDFTLDATLGGFFIAAGVRF